MSASDFNLTIRNSIAELGRISEALEQHGARHNWPSRWIFEINLALDELVTNAINYGYDDDARHEIKITGREQNDALVVTLTDDGRAFNPFADAPQPDLSADVAARKVGGLGVHLVRELIDEVAYQRRDAMNIVTLVQHRAAAK